MSKAPVENEAIVESKFKPYDASQEPIFPPELTLKSDLMHKQPLLFKGPQMAWFRPVSLAELLRLKETYPEAKLVVGNSELGVEMKFKKMAYPVMIQPNRVPELSRINITEEGIVAGASVTWSSLEDVIMSLPKSHKTKVFEQITQMLRWFAGKQIRNVGSIGGNIMTGNCCNLVIKKQNVTVHFLGSPISDLNPIFMAANCTLTLASKDKTRQVKFDHGFYTGYRQTILEPNEILVDITIPFTNPNERFVAFKQARRRDDDIAIVNGAFYYSLDKKTSKIDQARMAFGGLSFVTKMAPQTCDYLLGKEWSQPTFEGAMEILLQEFPLPPDVPGSMVRYRQTLALSLFFKSYLSLSEASQLDPKEVSAAQVFHKDPLRGSQLFEIIPETQKDHDPLRRPLKHSSADKQATGEAIYVDDIPRMQDELYLGFVMSKKAHAKLIDIDATEALKDEGVVNFFCHRDIDPKNNVYRMIYETDEWLFAQDEVLCVGQIIGVIVASTQQQALAAADKVKVTYQDLEAIVTIDEAIEKQSFLPLFGPRIKASEDIEHDLEQCDSILESETNFETFQI